MKLFFNNASFSWRCRLPPATQWAMWYNSGIPSPLNLLLLTNTTNLYWKFMGLSADGAAFQMLTLRWVYPNTEKSVKFVKTQHDMVTFTPTGHYFLKEASSCSEARNVFPVTQAHGLNEATAQGMLLCGIV